MPVNYFDGYHARSLEGEMRLIESRDVRALTGLSANQLREWTVRRALVAPDVQPQGRGNRARFSWQTVLVLRLAVVLKKFHIELTAHKSLFVGFQRQLAETSFLSLRGKILLLRGGGEWELRDAEGIGGDGNMGDALLLPLSPHLQILSDKFGLPDPMKQLPLFPALGVEEEAVQKAPRASSLRSTGTRGQHES